jgi:hypothetical protein
VEGVELNPTTAAYARRRTAATIHQLDVRDFAEGPNRFAAVTLIDVLEHIPDPLPVLAMVRELLDAGGWLAIKVPCGPSQLVKERVRHLLRPSHRMSLADNLVHVSHFSPRSLRLALSTAGFRAVTVHAGAPELSAAARWRVGHVVSSGIRRALYMLARAVPGAVHTPLALNLIAYARRT